MLSSQPYSNATILSRLSRSNPPPDHRFLVSEGGWPTIWYFNKKTGVEGSAYAKKTSDAMCTELGPGKPYMQQYIEEAGGEFLIFEPSCSNTVLFTQLLLRTAFNLPVAVSFRDQLVLDGSGV